ncbi:hypothetical protein N7491_004461 [Penicillium cf. griseofulvum]|uniref:SMP-30/Gluconolactonase/LRE-like region domain-containing protein n=1 Tax=Penicillium cf. griseofulvum TaxID=2972120 RepID=A0A9W9J2N7_9EURO|nr:hypothetical protein N7472_007150 [Penicillium cf. griseofulvum]KAJ5422917.1 hypothetical protein N7445_011025 [Penicillium cf. griseofulvum]KAJ5433866.1 hypothetical protein N7491_004461 [Penicillium cf. griseofulvum]
MLSPIFSVLIPIFFLFVATLVSCTPTSAINPVVSAVYQFPRGAYLENLAVGHESILVTRADTPSLYQITLPARPHASAYASLIHHFPNATGLMGITEYAPNTFAVIVGNFSMTKLVPGTWSVWSVQIFDKNHPTVEKIVDLIEGQFLNGMTILNKTGAILIADSLAGCVYRLDVRTGDYEVVLEHESMKATGAIGLNGIRTVTTTTESFLYYDNSKTTTVNRVAIDPVSGSAKGKYITLAHGFYADDLAYDYETGDVWVAGNADNTIFRINSNGEEIVVANASSTPSVMTPSSLAFGKGRHSRTLFGTTYAGVAPNGTVTGGNLLAIDVGIEKR